MRSLRCCSRNGCPRPAAATLTYVYADSTAVVGPLATVAEPHSYDLCEHHARSLTAPRGWELVRHDDAFGPPSASSDDLVALAEAVREAGRSSAAVDRSGSGTGRPGSTMARPGSATGHRRQSVGRRGHLRVIPPSS